MRRKRTEGESHNFFARADAYSSGWYPRSSRAGTSAHCAPGEVVQWFVERAHAGYISAHFESWGRVGWSWARQMRHWFGYGETFSLSLPRLPPISIGNGVRPSRGGDFTSFGRR